MIKKLIIKNFENHEITILDDFSDKLNLISGPSDSGKSSSIRALGLLAYNLFDHKCVRIGEKFCEVYAETEIGNVLARRGQSVNHWETQVWGKEKKEFNNIGKAILPEVQEILGLKLITLSDIPIKINIMNQLESHFLMAEVGGEKASGSIRAQIIDEISGLSGMEAIIKEVSTDHLRFKKESNSKDDEISELKKKLFDEEILKEEEKLLNYLDDSLNKIKSNQAKMDAYQLIVLQTQNINNLIQHSENQLKSYPSDEDIACIADDLTKIQSLMKKSNNLLKNKQEIDLINKKLINISNEYKEIGDLDLINYDKIQSLFIKIKNLKAILEKNKLLNDKMNSLSEELRQIPNIESLNIDKIYNKLYELQEKKKLINNGIVIKKRYVQNKKEIEDLEPEIKKLHDELHQQFEEYGVCPLCER